MMANVLYQDASSLSVDCHYLERPRLAGILEQAMENPVVEVVAGQGYGKTSSVYSLLKNYPAVSLWVQILEQDNVCGRFWENLCATIALRNSRLGKGMSGIGFPQTDRDFDRFYMLVEQSIRDIQAISPVHYVIVYDDFHLISNPVMLDFFDRVLAFPFSNTTVVLISRTEPQVKTLPLLSKGLLAGITVEDLRFSKEETAAYFSLWNVTVSEEDLDPLYRDTEGWPQVLSLIAQNAEKQNGGRLLYSPELIKLPLFRMIETSFFSSQSAAARKFLIKLSLTGYWPLDLLKDLEGAEEITGGLDKVTPLIRYDSYLNGYRIHNLLIEFLKEKQGELSPEERREVYQKAAAWCVKNNLRIDAAGYYEQARDYQGIINLCLAYPMHIPREAASFLLAIVDRLIRGEDDPPRAVLAESADSLLYLRYALRPKLLLALGRFKETAVSCGRSIAEFEALPPNSINARILMSMYASLGFLRVLSCRDTKDYCFAPFFEKAYYHFQSQGVRIGEKMGQGILPPYISQVGFPAEAGEFEQYQANITPAVSVMVKIGNLLGGVDILGKCEYSYFQGDLGAAENFARQAIIQSRENRQHETENRGIFFLLRISIHRGDFPEIENLFRQLLVQLEIDDYQNRFILYDIECGWFYAQTGNPTRAASWIKGGFGGIEFDDYYHPLETMVKAKCLFAGKEYQAVLDTLDRWKKKNESKSFHSYLLGKLEMTVLEAACHIHLDRRAAALEKLEEAWRISEAEGFVMPFIELGEDMRLLASAALEEADHAGGPEGENRKSLIPPEWLETQRSKAAAYGKMVFAAAEYGPKPRTQTAGGDQGLQENNVLRRRETAVLRALSQGLTREEISRREGLPLHRVKEIIGSIYRKLGAVNRADAIRIAAAAGLLKNFRH
ncbi:MAG: LuxR C-terminal-related transcriptional regulator [Treponema sp.]|jgi:LuxR family maltose regulon positive regulatory protein|nr:LuxR C-terminal-related transcriptional regulator [Treponema sp.]